MSGQFITQGLNNLYDAATAAKYAQTTLGQVNGPLLSGETQEAFSHRLIRIDLVYSGSNKNVASVITSAVCYLRGTPDELTSSIPTRTGVSQTRGGIWIEDFGRGVSELTMRGITGMRRLPHGKTGEIKDGRQIYKELMFVYDTYLNTRKQLYETGGDIRDVQMRFHMPMNDWSLIVHPRTWVIRQSKVNPMTYSYEINLIVLGEFAGKNEDVDTNGSIAPIVKVVVAIETIDWPSLAALNIFCSAFAHQRAERPCL